MEDQLINLIHYSEYDDRIEEKKKMIKRRKSSITKYNKRKKFHSIFLKNLNDFPYYRLKSKSVIWRRMGDTFGCYEEDYETSLNRAKEKVRKEEMKNLKKNKFTDLEDY